MPQTPSVEHRPRVPLVTPLGSRFGEQTTDSRLINGFAEKDESGNWEVYKRPGAGVFVTLDFPVGVAVGQYLAFQGSIDNVLSFYFDSVSGNVTIFKNGVSLSSVGGSAGVRTTASQYADNKVGLNTGGNFVRDYTVSTGVVASNAVPTGNALIPGIATLDDTTYVMDDRALIWGSGIGNVVFGGNFSQARSEPGNGVFLTKQGNFVVALKTFSTEFFYDAINATGNPISPARGMEFKWGCADSRSVQSIDDVLFWLARSRESTAFIAMMVKQQPQRISPPWVDRLLREAVFLSVPMFSLTFKSQGHTFYGLTVASNTIGGLSITVIYDVTQQLWYLWQSPGASTRWPFVYSITTVGGANVFQSNTDNTTLYGVSPATTTDVGVVFPVDIYTENADFGSRRVKTLSRMDFIADQQPAFLQARFSEDDQKTWSEFRAVDLNQKRPNLIDCGSFKRRSWNFRYEAPYTLRLSAVELDMAAGS